MAKMKKEKNGLYRKNLVLGKRPDGTYIRKPVYGKTQRELEQKIKEITQQLNHGIRVWENSMTFRELANIWYDNYNTEAGETWKYGQALIIKKLLMPSLAEMRICDLRQLHLQTIITAMSKKGYATSYMKKVKQIADRIMEVAVGSDLIMRNPFSQVKVPRKDPTPRRALTEEEIALITQNWRGHQLGAMAMIMIYAGLRKGEAIALQWENIDFEHRVIKVRQSACNLKNVTTIKEPKTKAGVRDVPIPNVLLSVLMEIRKPSGFVFTNNEGGIMSDTSFKRQWHSFQSYLNICAGGQNGAGRYIHRVVVIDNITAHMLRHTYATILFDANVDVKSAQKFLGHADIEVTLAVYTHLTKYKEDKAIEALNGHLDEMIENGQYSKVTPIKKIEAL